MDHAPGIAMRSPAFCLGLGSRRSLLFNLMKRIVANFLIRTHRQDSFARGVKRIAAQFVVWLAPAR